MPKFRLTWVCGNDRLALQTRNARKGRCCAAANKSAESFGPRGGNSPRATFFIGAMIPHFCKTPEELAYLLVSRGMGSSSGIPQDELLREMSRQLTLVNYYRLAFTPAANFPTFFDPPSLQLQLQHFQTLCKPNLAKNVGKFASYSKFGDTPPKFCHGAPRAAGAAFSTSCVLQYVYSIGNAVYSSHISRVCSTRKPLRHQPKINLEPKQPS